MGVIIGDIITASQYNTLAANVNKWFADDYSTNLPTAPKTENNYGWGGTPVSTVPAGTIISSEQANELINRVNLGITQTGVGTTLDKIDTGDVVLASDYNAIETQANLVSSNRLTCADHTTTSGGTAASYSRSTSWSSSISITITAEFGSYANARYFFNSGGQIRLSFNNSGTTNDALAWDDLFDSDDMGSLIFSYNNIAQTGTRAGNPASSSGFYELSTTSTEKYNINLDESPYTENDFRLSVYRDSDGSRVIFVVTMNNDDPQAEVVNGTTTVYVDTRKADDKNLTDPNVGFSISGPTFSSGGWSGS